MKTCNICGREFKENSNRQKYCEKCRANKKYKHKYNYSRRDLSRRVNLSPTNDENLTGGEALRLAILQQAVFDLKIELETAAKTGQVLATIRPLVKFFLSDWGQFLSGGNGEYIVEKCKSEVFRNGKQ